MIQPTGIPGKTEYQADAILNKQAAGGLTIVTPDGKHLHVGFRMDPEIFNHTQKLEESLREVVKELIRLGKAAPRSTA